MDSFFKTNPMRRRTKNKKEKHKRENFRDGIFSFYLKKKKSNWKGTKKKKKENRSNKFDCSICSIEMIVHLFVRLIKRRKTFLEIEDVIVTVQVNKMFELKHFISQSTTLQNTIERIFSTWVWCFFYLQMVMLSFIVPGMVATIVKQKQREERTFPFW